jgi:hypothetical protein
VGRGGDKEASLRDGELLERVDFGLDIAELQRRAKKR